MRKRVALRLLAAGSLVFCGNSIAGTHDVAPATLAAIRLNYAQVSRWVKQGRLLQVKRDFGCLNGQDSVRIIWKDGSGRVRKYLVSSGTSDSAATISQYYGSDGRLSFALIEAGAVNGTNLEIRLYYGTAGKLVKQEDRLVSGPGYPFWQLTQDVAQVPEAAFSKPAPCS